MTLGFGTLETNGKFDPSKTVTSANIAPYISTIVSIWWDGDETTGDLSGNYYAFTGRRYDSESELMHYRHRYYAPLLGRFITRDPAETRDVQSLYLYVRGAPTRGLDPLGLWTLTKPPTPKEALKCLQKLAIAKIVASLAKELSRIEICAEINVDCTSKGTKPEKGEFSKTDTFTAESDFNILIDFYKCLRDILLPDVSGIGEDILEEDLGPDFELPDVPSVPSLSGITSFAGEVKAEWWCAGKDTIKYQKWGFLEAGGAKRAKLLEEGKCAKSIGRNCECCRNIYGD